MSGNTTQTGLHAGQGGLAVAGYNLLPIPLFVAGVFAGTLIWHSALAQASRWLFALVAGLLALGLAAVAPGPLPGWFGIVVLSLAMGIMNTTVTRVGEQRVSLGYVTGILNNLAQHLALAVKGAPLSHAEGPHDTHPRRAGLLAGIWTAFVIGAYPSL
ncbi:MAG: YoaK family protein [Methyloceanibacter sp.]